MRVVHVGTTRGARSRAVRRAVVLLVTMAVGATGLYAAPAPTAALVPVVDPCVPAVNELFHLSIDACPNYGAPGGYRVRMTDVTETAAQVAAIRELEAQAAADVAALFDVPNDERLWQWARPQLRAAAFARLMEARETPTARRTAQQANLYSWMQLHQQQIDILVADYALYEYERWKAQPCAWKAPSPPDFAWPNKCDGIVALLPNMSSPSAENFRQWGANSALDTMSGDPDAADVMLGVYIGGAMLAGAAVATGFGVAAAGAVAAKTAAIVSVIAPTVAAAVAKGSYKAAALAVAFASGAGAATAGAFLILTLAIILVAVSVVKLAEAATVEPELLADLARAETTLPDVQALPANRLGPLMTAIVEQTLPEPAVPALPVGFVPVPNNETFVLSQGPELNSPVDLVARVDDVVSRDGRRIDLALHDGWFAIRDRATNSWRLSLTADLATTTDVLATGRAGTFFLQGGSVRARVDILKGNEGRHLWLARPLHIELDQSPRPAMTLHPTQFSVTMQDLAGDTVTPETVQWSFGRPCEVTFSVSAGVRCLPQPPTMVSGTQVSNTWTHPGTYDVTAAITASDGRSALLRQSVVVSPGMASTTIHPMRRFGTTAAALHPGPGGAQHLLDGTVVEWTATISQAPDKPLHARAVWGDGTETLCTYTPVAPYTAVGCGVTELISVSTEPLVTATAQQLTSPAPGVLALTMRHRYGGGDGTTKPVVLEVTPFQADTARRTDEVTFGPVQRWIETSDNLDANLEDFISSSFNVFAQTAPNVAGVPVTGPSISAGPASICTFSLTDAAATYTAGLLHRHDVGDCTISYHAPATGGASAASLTRVVTFRAAPQSISLGEIPDQTAAPGKVVLLTITASGPTSWTVKAYGACTPDGDGFMKARVILTGAGSCLVEVIRSTKFADRFFEPARAAGGFTIAKATQVVELAQISNQVLPLGGGPVVVPVVTSVPAPGTDLELVASPESVCAVVGGQLLAVGWGQCTVTAQRPADDSFEQAEATRTFHVFESVPPLHFTNPPSTLEVGAVYIPTWAPDNEHDQVAAGGACELERQNGLWTGRILMLREGVCSVGVQGINGTVNHAFPVTARQQVVVFTSQPPDGPVVGGTYQASATGGGSAQPVVFSATGACTATTSGLVSFTLAGTCFVHADQAGSGAWAAAPRATQEIQVGGLVQVVSFDPAPPTTAQAGQVIVLSATGGASGKPVTFSAAGPCVVDGSSLELLSFGTCQVVANQAGDERYLAAEPVAVSVAVRDTQTVELGADLATTALVGERVHPFAVSSLGLPASVDASGSCEWVDGAYVELTEPGTCTLTPRALGNGFVDPVEGREHTITVVTEILRSQSIVFTSDPPAPAWPGLAYTVTAEAPGGPVTFSTPPVRGKAKEVCRVEPTSGVVEFLTSGTCRIRADQLGGGGWEPAPQAEQVIDVAAREPSGPKPEKPPKDPKPPKPPK